MSKYRLSAMVTISMIKVVDADSEKQALLMSNDLTVPALCHQCSCAGENYDDEWQLSGGLDGEPTDITVDGE